MAKLIETPYGSKTPELLCSAMDAYSIFPEVLDALYTAFPFVEDCEQDSGYKPGSVTKAIKKINAAITAAEKVKVLP